MRREMLEEYTRLGRWVRSAMYLRKSRAEEHMSLEDTLRRHKAALTAYAERYGYQVLPEDIYEEVVSGESLFSRPKMLQLMEAVSARKYEAVLCMDMQRLGRGGMYDQGFISKEEQEEALADAGITCRCLVRLPQEDHTAQVADWTVTEAPPAVPQNLSFRQETLPGEGLLDPRKTLPIGAYDISCQAVAEAMLSRALGPVETLGKTLVLGTEECMYPALILGEKLERLGAEVYCHATTRSPIGLCDAPGYPIRSGWKLPSFYEEERTTYVYNLREYDTVIVLSDTKKTDLRAIQALASGLTCKHLIYTQGEGYVWKLSKG